MNASAPTRLLVRGVNWLGDAVMTTPALVRLRQALPGARISLLGPAKLRDLWTRHPAVDEVLSFEPGESPWTIGRRLRPMGFDAALVLPNSPRSALECRMGRIPRRIGVARPLRNWLLTVCVEPRPQAVRMWKPSPHEVRERVARGLPRPAIPDSAHHVHDYLHLARALGADPAPVPPLLVVGEDEVAAARSEFGLAAEATWIGLNPGAEYGPAKRWPEERFAEVPRLVRASGVSVRWVVLGGPNDTDVAGRIAAGIPGALNLAGRMTLRQLMAVLGACSALVTNDTGPMHVAAALGVPVVVPFGSTSPELTGPGLPGDTLHRPIISRVPCAPCFLRECPIDLRCLRGISPETVAAAVGGVIRTKMERAKGIEPS